MSNSTWRWAALAGGSLAACFSNGMTGTVWGAWLAPALLLAFVMTTRAWIGVLGMAGVWSVAGYIMFRGALPMPEAEYIAVSVIGGLLSAVPYALHRVAAPQLDRFTGTLVFPTAATALTFIAASGTPFGTWGNEAYTQLDFAPLAQLASVIGIWGITFLIGWCASILAALLTSPAPRPVLAPVLFALCLIGVLGYGLLRQQMSFDDAPKVRVAALSNPADVTDKFFEGCNDRADLGCRSQKARGRWGKLFERSRKAAREGAKIIVWYESAAQYDKPIEEEFIAEAKAFARDNGVYLIIGAAVAPQDPNAPFENKAMAFTPEGGLAFTYHKAKPVPGEPIRAGDGVIPTLDTPHGRVGAMVCFDADFPELSRQAAARGIDILAVPSNDWPEITPLHGEMVRFRAIESGFSVVRATSNGLSIITDPIGRALKRVNSFENRGGIAIADVPARQVATLYGQVDDLFAGLCLLATVVLIALAMAKALLRRKRIRASGEQAAA
jgi:apolipoprotein N-acyltransferase